VQILVPHIEALIFAAEEPVTAQQISKLIKLKFESSPGTGEIRKIINQIIEKYDSDEHGIHITMIGEGYQFYTKGSYHDIVEIFIRENNQRKLSKAALETLAIIAYKQPVTKAEIESVRGVNCDYTVQKLLDKELVELKGRSEGPGRPMIYATSSKFMNYFGLSNLKDLPQLKDIEEPDNSIGETENLLSKPEN
jgi:segregation and condensation protein B